MSTPPLEGWRITKSHHSAFVRTFDAYPEAHYPLEHHTQERKGDRTIAATYPARLASVSIRFQWDEKQGRWWGQARQDVQLISEDTGEPYKKGWRSEIIRDHFTSFVAHSTPEYIKSLLAATEPQTTITVTETPK